MALGQDEAQEYQDGLTRVAEVLKGTVGLLFTRLPREEVGHCFTPRALSKVWPAPGGVHGR